MLLKQSSSLPNVGAMALDYFNNRDPEGLQRLLNTLQLHHEQERIAYFIPMLHGYLAELNNEPEVAIEAYQRIAEGSAHKNNALMRLFELYIKAEDNNSALKTLKSLANKQSVYLPLYADMLQSTGDIDTAVEVYTDYLLTNPDDLNAMMKLGKLFLQEEMVEGVAWTMSYILDKDPENQAALQILNEMGLSLEGAETSKHST